MDDITFAELNGFLETLDKSAITMDGFDDCAVGLVSNGSDYQVVYSEEAIINKLCKDMDYDDALEYYSFNIEGSLGGEGMPLILEANIVPE